MLALDHIVISGKNAKSASSNYGRQFSIKAIKGGEHKNWGTYNYLAYFSNESYIEWLGVSDESKLKTADNPLIHHLFSVLEENKEPIAFQFALRTNEMDDYVTHFKQNNIPFTGPVDGRRTRPDGTELKWRMLFPTFDYKAELLPFLIEWETPNTAFSLSNPQAITRIDLAGISKERFAEVYRLKSRRIYKNFLPLQNTKIYFRDHAGANKLSFAIE
ncbi:VOC family protein [Virgibacillus sp. 179-BFC.A HS]|uniref:VOC family protein n=1 Tax=Tigheibacillus jepli TaxID=3035914 RepID=A0ABU5CL11_9BACI|nr:VOC family protein [Virgibacillus sp. 179-BFC.A HS]MDY0406910.1 VOC family protein [Virgibacillus sp. 179-BFC.A HS]